MPLRSARFDCPGPLATSIASICASRHLSLPAQALGSADCIAVFFGAEHSPEAMAAVAPMASLVELLLAKGKRVEVVYCPCGDGKAAFARALGLCGAHLFRRGDARESTQSASLTNRWAKAASNLARAS